MSVKEMNFIEDETRRLIVEFRKSFHTKFNKSLNDIQFSLAFHRMLEYGDLLEADEKGGVVLHA